MDKYYYKDITKEFIGYKNKIKIMKKNEKFNYKNKTYIIDDHFIKYNISDDELDVIKRLYKRINKKIVFIPQIMKPEGIRTPDIRIDNTYFDIKTIHGNSKQVLYHRVRNNNEQAHNFIIDIHKDSKLDIKDIILQADKIFRSNRKDCDFVNILIIVKFNNYIVIKKSKHSSGSRQSICSMTK